MKQLLIIRHAKSDWDDPDLSDFDRPLNKRGRKNAPEMAKRLLNKQIMPQQLVSSPALRALTTAQYFADTLQINRSDIKQEKSIYEATASTLLKVVNNLNDKYGFIALFGHNPGMTNLANSLCDADIYDIPTCGMVMIEFPFDKWDLTGSRSGELKFFDYPKNEAEEEY